MVHPRGPSCGKRSDLAIGKISEIVASYLCGGMTQTDIARVSGVSQVWASRKLRSHGVRLREWRHRGGPGHSCWKGGRWLVGGYAHMWIGFDHPYSSMADATGYVREHRLRMAEKLGRPLEAHETVHHLDGDKLNNRVDNLQVRLGRHGKGVVMRCRCCGSTDIEAAPLHGH